MTALHRKSIQYLIRIPPNEMVSYDWRDPKCHRLELQFVRPDRGVRTIIPDHVSVTPAEDEYCVLDVEEDEDLTWRVEGDAVGCVRNGVVVVVVEGGGIVLG